MITAESIANAILDLPAVSSISVADFHHLNASEQVRCKAILAANLHKLVKLYPECYSDLAIEVLAQMSSSSPVKRLIPAHGNDLEKMCGIFGRGLPENGFSLVLNFEPEPELPKTETIIDLLGCYRRNSKEIILFIRKVANVAKDLSCDATALGRIVFIHEFAHWLDFDGRRRNEYENDYTIWNETLAQLVTWKLVEKETNAKIFKDLSERQPVEYKLWEHFNPCSFEDVTDYVHWFKGNSPSNKTPQFYETHRSWFRLPRPANEQLGASQEHETEILDDPDLV